LRIDTRAQAEQVRSVSVERMGALIGRLPAPLMAALDDALRLHLAVAVPPRVPSSTGCTPQLSNAGGCNPSNTWAAGKGYAALATLCATAGSSARARISATSLTG